MNEKLALALAGFLNLNNEERESFLKEARKIHNTSKSASTDLQKIILDSVVSNENFSIKFGPVPNDGCPCCGR